jgi:hypothetical protein
MPECCGSTSIQNVAIDIKAVKREINTRGSEILSHRNLRLRVTTTKAKDPPYRVGFAVPAPLQG